MVGDHLDESEPVPASTSPDVAGVIGDAPLDLGYTVTVDSFSGPLDLLLYLVRRTELDILEVPLSLIIDQFIDTVRSWQDADLDVAGEFILMAATLLELKARTIAPPLDQPEEGAEDEPAFDPRESLLRSLLAYRRFKEAAQGLDGLETARRPLVERQVREHVPEAPPEEGDFDLGEIDLSLLATTCERVLSRIGGLGPRTVMVDEMPLGTRIATMLDELAVRERTTISELLAGNHSRVVHITTVMATLELTRQRFVEVAQPQQFGEIALRLRSVEERERLPELPPPEADGPKRRRRLPLVTFSAPAAAGAATGDEDTIEATPEEPAENDEQRFLRELEETTRVGAVLAITANVEKSFTEHWYTLHPELKPVIAPPPPVPEPVVKRFSPRRTTPPAAPPANDVSAAPVTETPAAETPATTTESAVPVAAVDVASAAPETTPAPVAAVVAETPVMVESAVVAPPFVDPLLPAVAPVMETVPPVEPSVAEITSVAEPVPSANSDVPAVAGTSAATLADPISAIPEPMAAVSPAVLSESPTSGTPAIATTNEVPAPPEQHVLPVEEWPVLHAMPVPEEVSHPLDTVSSDDPAEVNARLAGQASRAAERAEVDDDEEEEDLDPDELLADDPALVNAALQADRPRAPVERRSTHDVIIPPPTDTTVWTAPVDRGQTTAEVNDDTGASPIVAPAPVIAEEVAEATGSSASAPVVAETPVVELPTVVAATVAPIAAQPSMAAPVPTGIQIVEPSPSTEPLSLPETSPEPQFRASVATTVEDLEPDDQEDLADGLSANDPALVDAALQALQGDEPRASIDLHPVHQLTIPTATETTVWTAPVDRGQTAAGIDDESEESQEIAAADEVTAELVMAAMASVATAPAAQPVARVLPEVISSPPASAPVLASPPSPPPEDWPPPAPPPLSPPPPARADSSLPAPAPTSTTTQTATRPMSPPPRSKAWLLIAIFIAINAAWAGWTWFTWVPRAVLEVAATERSGAPGQELLTWRFNLDVVDAVGQAKPPELVPIITPPLPGRWHWSSPRTLVFEVAGPLPLATTFTATLASEQFRSVQGFRLHAPAQQIWSTPALAVSSAVVETFDREGTTIALTFNQPVDPLAIAKQLAVEWPVGDVVVTTTPAVAPTLSASISPLTSPSDPAPTVTDSAPAVDAAVASMPAELVDQSATRTPSVSVDAKIVDLTAELGKELGTDALTAVATPASTLPAPVPLVRAMSSEPATTIRLVLAAPVRGRATLRLRAGTTGVAGSLGLVQAWEQQVALQQTLHLTTGEVVIASHGDVRVDVAVSDPGAPRELLAPVVTVEPSVPVTVTTTATGVSLVGPFAPGESYRIAIAATWPDEPSTSGHVLSAYTAASAVSISIPQRPAGIWPLGDEVIDGLQRLAAHAVPRADVMLLTGSDDECVASREITWTSPGDAPALLDLDDLTLDQPAAQYRLRVTSGGEQPVISDQTLVVEQLHVRPQALFAALTDWTIAALAGNEDADVPVRVVRVASTKP